MEWEWLTIGLVFIAGFSVGYGLATYLENHRTSRIIGGIARPKHPTNKSIITTPRPLGRIDQAPKRRLPK